VNKILPLYFHGRTRARAISALGRARKSLRITKLPNFSSLRASPSEGEKWVPIPKNCHHYLKQLKSAPTESPNGSQSPYFSRREKHTLFLLDIVLHFVTPKAKRVTRGHQIPRAEVSRLIPSRNDQILLESRIGVKQTHVMFWNQIKWRSYGFVRDYDIGLYEL
jgi:hypothetical protein